MTCTTRRFLLPSSQLFAKRVAKGANERSATVGKHQVNMPARPYVGISEAYDQEIGEIIMHWVLTNPR